MTYKEFCNWCNERACDGRWGIALAASCSECISDVNHKLWFKREKYFQQEYGESVEQVLTNWKKIYNKTEGS